MRRHLTTVARLSACLLLVLGGCSMLRSPELPTLPEAASDEANYHLFPGDAIRVDVFDVQSLSGEFRIDEAGHIIVPLIGSVTASNLTPAELASVLTVRLSATYLKDPNVTVRLQEYRHVFVLGEVTRPGDYPYAIGTTVLNAIASAGGFAYRADRGNVVVTRSGLRYKAALSARIQPGDMIEIGERYF